MADQAAVVAGPMTPVHSSHGGARDPHPPAHGGAYKPDSPSGGGGTLSDPSFSHPPLHAEAPTR